MNTEEHELCLKAAAEERSTKRVVAEHWEPSANGHHHPLFVGFVIPEEMESEDFNEKILKKLNEHNEAKGIEFATRQSRARFQKRKNCIEISKTVSCSHSLRCKNEEEVRHNRINRSKRYTSNCKAGITFKCSANTKKHAISSLEYHHCDHPMQILGQRS